jgi:hypothetical protein
LADLIVKKTLLAKELNLKFSDLENALNQALESAQSLGASAEENIDKLSAEELADIPISSKGSKHEHYCSRNPGRNSSGSHTLGRPICQNTRRLADRYLLPVRRAGYAGYAGCFRAARKDR